MNTFGTYVNYNVIQTYHTFRTQNFTNLEMTVFWDIMQVVWQSDDGISYEAGITTKFSSSYFIKFVYAMMNSVLLFSSAQPILWLHLGKTGSVELGP